MAPGLAALLLLLLVAALARDAGEAGPVADGDLAPLVGLFPVLAAVAMVLVGAVLIGALLSEVLQRDRGSVPRRLLPLVLAVVALVWLSSMLPRPPAPQHEDAARPPEEGQLGAPVDAPDWLPSGPALLLVVVAMVVGGLLVARVVRTADDGTADPGADDDEDEDEDDRETAARARRGLVVGLDEVIGQLRADPDPRRAVIRAWARLEDLLAEHQLPRGASEAPTTYVARVLDRLATSRSAVHDLTTAFERAMFSPHAISRGDQLAAADALLAVRHDLEARV